MPFCDLQAACTYQFCAPSSQYNVTNFMGIVNFNLSIILFFCREFNVLNNEKDIGIKPASGLRAPKLKADEIKPPEKRKYQISLLTDLSIVYVTSYSKRYLKTIATCYWFCVNSIQALSSSLFKLGYFGMLSSYC